MDQYHLAYASQINPLYNSANNADTNCTSEKPQVNSTADSSCKCQDMEKKLDEVKATMNSQMNSIQAQLQLALESLEEQKDMIHELLKTREESLLEQALPLHTKFPLKTDHDLHDLNDDITPANRNQYMKAISSLLYPEGVGKNLRNILSDEITQDYNVDGVQGKKSFKTLENFYSLLLDSITVTPTSGTAEVQLRKAIQLQKRRHFKKISISKNSLEPEIDPDYDSEIEEKVLLRKRFKKCDPLETVVKPREREKERESTAFSKFPLRTERQLLDLNNAITISNRNLYIKVMKSLLNPNGIRKNLKNILSEEITQAYNLEGVHGKKSFKSLTNFYQVLIESITVTTESGTADVQLRTAIQLQKKRYFKNLSVMKRKKLNG